MVASPSKSIVKNTSAAPAKKAAVVAKKATASVASHPTYKEMVHKAIVALVRNAEFIN